MNYNIVAQTNENTVINEYTPLYKASSKGSDKCQSEADLEKEFIRFLKDQGYEYLNIHEESELIANLRVKLEELNDIKFSDDEWELLQRLHCQQKRRHR